MNKVFAVAAREFIETVRTKAFLLSSVLLPLVLVGVLFGAERVHATVSQDALPTRVLAVRDDANDVYAALDEQIAEFNVYQPTRPFALAPADEFGDDEAALQAAVNEGRIYAYLLIGADAVDANAPVVLGRQDAQLTARQNLQRLVQNAIVAVRAARSEPPIDLARVRALQRPVELHTRDTTTGAETAGDDLAVYLAPFAFMFLLFMGTFGVSQGLLTSLIEEKSTRVVEVLLAAVSPLQLMAGKVLGMVGVGLLLLAIWGALGYGSARTQGLEQLATPRLLLLALAYFVPTFLLFAGVLGGIGAACNTLKEAQSMTFPLSLMTTVPLLLWFQISEHPNSTLALTLSFIPPISPFVMILRISADPATPTWQIVVTLALLWATVVAVIWAAAKIFRVGVLMYGKPPTLGELVRWVRHPA